MAKEIKLYLDEPYLAMFEAEAKLEGRTLQGHIRRITEQRYEEQPKRRVLKPKRFIAGQIYNDKTGQFDNISEVAE